LGNPLGAVERYKHPILDTYNLAVAEQKPVDYSKIQLRENQLDFLKESLVKRFPNLSGQKFEEYCKAYLNEFIAFKNTRRLITFDDVIEKVASDMFPKKLIPTFELLIIDEAQDLSNHLWKLASKLINAAKTSYIAGDDDQAIMMGIGANPLTFVNYQTSEQDMPLINSYRIPKLLRNYVDAGIMPELEKLPNRVGVTWEPNEKIGNLNSNIKKQKTNEKGESFEIQIPYSPRELINIIYKEYFQITDRINSDNDQINTLQYNIISSNVPDWLIMAPTKGTGQKLSDALKELEIPHYYRNKPVLGATIEKTLIRVQTVHMSKGDEAKNSAIVVQSYGDVVMLAKDPRLSYVAATRASDSCYPNICMPGLLGAMKGSKNDFFGKCAHKYQKMFPLSLN
jgi:ATP-dependent exoDNAse (exonuclease V) beta subunit